MAKKTKRKSYFINREGLEGVIMGYCDIQSTECKNPVNQQTRYTLIKESNVFYLDVFFKGDNTISVMAVNTGQHVGLAQEMESIIDSSLSSHDVTRGTFNAKINLEQFTALKEYITSLKGVEKLVDEDKGVNGLLVKFTTDFGDAVTLTYYNSKGKMYFNGYFMNLYIIIKEYITPLTAESISNTSIIRSVNSATNVERLINENLPEGYKLLDPIMAGFIADSFTMIVADTKLNDYAAWVMPTMRVLEHAIKRVCLDNNIFIDDKRGFYYYKDANQQDVVPLFTDNAGSIAIHPQLANHLNIQLDSDTISVLIGCYDYLKKNRHEMFHTIQIVEGTKLVPTPEDARATIMGACQLIEESLVFNL